MKSTNDKIDEILEKHRHDYWDYCKNLIDSTEFEKREDEAKQELAKLIKETLQECIGSKEYIKEGYGKGMPDHKMYIRNQLRKEALNKLDSLLDPQEY